MRQPWRQQPHKPILVRLFSSNINFKGVYLQQDIITRPSIVPFLYYYYYYYYYYLLIGTRKTKSYKNQSQYI